MDEEDIAVRRLGLEALLSARSPLGELVTLLKSATGRALGPENLVTREEARRELRCSNAAVDALLKRVRPHRSGRPTLYLWRDVLRASGSYRSETNTNQQRRRQVDTGPREDI